MFRLRPLHAAFALYLVTAFVTIPTHADTTTATPPPSAPAAAPAPTDAARAQESRRILKERNLRVCRESADGTLRFIGFTQADERRLVQVRVTQILRIDSGETVGGVRETSVWDPPENWRLCPE